MQLTELQLQFVAVVVHTASRYDGDSVTIASNSQQNQQNQQTSKTNKPAHPTNQQPANLYPAQTCIPHKPVSRANLHTDASLHTHPSYRRPPFSFLPALGRRGTLQLHTILPLVACTIVLALCYLRTRVLGTCGRIETLLRAYVVPIRGSLTAISTSDF